jgi:hypothetical protein
MDLLTDMALPVLLVLGLALMLMREDARLRHRARDQRELRLEGLEELRTRDPYPEDAIVRGGYLREPDGRPIDADRVLEEELEVAREHTRSLRSGKGAECLL